jgi:hypothetical protein
MKEARFFASQRATGNMISLIILILIFPTFLNTLSCSKSPTEPEAQIQLTLEDVSCIEAWLRLQVGSISGSSSNVVIQRDGLNFMNFQLYEPYKFSNLDTTIIDDSLLPNKTYKYRAILTDNGKIVNTSSELTVTTMDTTSHNFTWQTFTFGEHSSSVLYDVAIINENSIWAVGEIYMKDSLGRPDHNAYNAVHWDGSSWRLKRIYFPTVCGSSSLTSYPAKAIFAFNDGQIWTSSSGDKIAILKDNVQINKFCLPSNVSMSINKIWGTSSNDLYIVGNGGNIAHYSGPTVGWRKIESGTDVNLTDIYATPDGKEIWTCGWKDNNGNTVLLEIKNHKSNIIWNNFNPNPDYHYRSFLSSVWASSNKEFIITGGEVYRHSLVDKNITRIERVGRGNVWEILRLGNFSYRIRGTERNDISLVGDDAMIWHFNGLSWHRFNTLLNENDRLYGLSTSNSLLVTVGKRYNGILSSALIIIGRR